MRGVSQVAKLRIYENKKNIEKSTHWVTHPVSVISVICQVSSLPEFGATIQFFLDLLTLPNITYQALSLTCPIL